MAVIIDNWMFGLQPKTRDAQLFPSRERAPSESCLSLCAAPCVCGLVPGRCPEAFPLPGTGARGGIPRRGVRGTRDRRSSLGGGLRSWLAVRCNRTAALNLTAPPSCGCYAGNQGPGARQIVLSRTEAIERKVVCVAEQILPSDRGPGAQRGVPRSSLWSEAKIVSSAGTRP